MIALALIGLIIALLVISSILKSSGKPTGARYAKRLSGVMATLLGFLLLASLIVGGFIALVASQ